MTEKLQQKRKPVKAGAPKNAGSREDEDENPPKHPLRRKKHVEVLRPVRPSKMDVDSSIAVTPDPLSAESYDSPNERGKRGHTNKHQATQAAQRNSDFKDARRAMFEEPQAVEVKTSLGQEKKQSRLNFVQYLKKARHKEATPNGEKSPSNTYARNLSTSAIIRAGLEQTRFGRGAIRHNITFDTKPLGETALKLIDSGRFMNGHSLSNNNEPGVVKKFEGGYRLDLTPHELTQQTFIPNHLSVSTRPSLGHSERGDGCKSPFAADIMSTSSEDEYPYTEMRSQRAWASEALCPDEKIEEIARDTETGRSYGDRSVKFGGSELTERSSFDNLHRYENVRQSPTRTTPAGEALPYTPPSTVKSGRRQLKISIPRPISVLEVRYKEGAQELRPVSLALVSASDSGISSDSPRSGSQTPLLARKHKKLLPPLDVPEDQSSNGGNSTACIESSEDENWGFRMLFGTNYNPDSLPEIQRSRRASTSDADEEIYESIETDVLLPEQAIHKRVRSESAAFLRSRTPSPRLKPKFQLPPPPKNEPIPDASKFMPKLPRNSEANKKPTDHKLWPDFRRKRN